MEQRRYSPKNEADPKPTKKEPRPNRSLLMVRPGGISAIEPEALEPDVVGWKAYGIICLPREWVPNFFVVSAASLAINRNVLERGVRKALAEANIATGNVIVRSSGVQETLASRGSFISAVCHSDAGQIVDTINKLTSQLPQQSIGRVHWIVQVKVPVEKDGHLSNERHLSKEHRDWVMEVEPLKNQPGNISNFGIRPWREGPAPADLDLNCASEFQIASCMRKVAHWATPLNMRFHFEWAWDGTKVWIVQADKAGERTGDNPTTLLPKDIAAISSMELAAFKETSAQHFRSYAKLKNVKLYSDLGYQMPRFWILDDQKILKEIFQGTIPSLLESDLSQLTKQPLILRTDGLSLPPDKLEMLPRSDELRSLEAAKEWLTTIFRKRIEEAALASASLCIVAHHFLPSVSSAWAGAEPGKRIVRIESLWGLPEGLYWHSHDIYEVDVQTKLPSPFEMNRWPIFQHLRYKGTFIAPDQMGRWIPRRTLPPFDWRSSIKQRKWIIEIASATRRVAEHERRPVSVMWLIDNDRRITRHSVLPWFHCEWKRGAVPKAAPPKKFTSSREHTILNQSDWSDLKALVQAGTRVERIIVKPTDPELIRNKEFAEELAGFSRRHKIVVELAGGILSHVFYVLQRLGAQVECTDLIGAGEDVIEFNKIVRDNIPSVISKRNERVEVIQLRGDALVAALRHKLIEEAYEVLDAKTGNEMVSELADVQEVIAGIASAIQVSLKHLNKERNNKRRRRGGFDQGYMLRKTTMPHSLSTQAPASPETRNLTPLPLEVEHVISDPAEIPKGTPYRRPDLRSVDNQIEKLFAFERELDKIDKSEFSAVFDLPLDGDEKRTFTLAIEFSRSRSVIRGKLRLKLYAQQQSTVTEFQLPLDFGK